MKHPEELAARLVAQWSSGKHRDYRLLNPGAWPLKLAIGKPSAKIVTGNPEKVMAHVQRWRSVSIGQVQWDQVQYRSTSKPVKVPTQWVLANSREWIAATHNREILAEFTKLKTVIDNTDSRFHSMLVRQRNLVGTLCADELIQATRLALLLEPGCAQGAPLRTLSLAGIDSKFFERHRALIVRLLDLRFDGLAGELGLEAFLDATSNHSHWLLVADLDGTLLPFDQIRVRDSELRNTPLPGSHVLIAENERCLHHLPALKDTIAILGAGLNLAWMQASWLRRRHIAYWGDIDTWGLTMLARARQYQPALHELLMTQEIFDSNCDKHAVVEPNPASHITPDELGEMETALYLALLKAKKGRIEQEFLQTADVQREILLWYHQVESS